MRFSKPVPQPGMDRFLMFAYRRYDFLDPFRRINLIQQMLLDMDISMTATLRLLLGEEERNGGVQGLWGRN